MSETDRSPAQLVASKSPAQNGACPYCAGFIPDEATDFVHESDCSWIQLATEVATANVARLHQTDTKARE